jgi:hypothetical protein
MATWSPGAPQEGRGSRGRAALGAGRSLGRGGGSASCKPARALVVRPSAMAKKIRAPQDGRGSGGQAAPATGRSLGGGSGSASYKPAGAPAARPSAMADKIRVRSRGLALGRPRF